MELTLFSDRMIIKALEESDDRKTSEQERFDRRLCSNTGFPVKAFFYVTTVYGGKHQTRGVGHESVFKTS